MVNFEQLAANILDPAVDVILLDTTFWGGIRPASRRPACARPSSSASPCIPPASSASSSRPCCISAPCCPNLTFAADAHYHHLADDIIEGGKLPYENGTIAVPTAPASASSSTATSSPSTPTLYEELGGYPYDRDPGRPDWFALVPNENWARP